MDDLDKLKKQISSYKNRYLKITPKSQQKRRNKNLSALNIGCEIAGAVVFAFIVGNFLDNYFKTKFIMTIVLLPLALSASFYTIYKSIKKHDD